MSATEFALPAFSEAVAPLKEKLDALHAQRLASWAPEALAVNVNQRKLLVDSFDDRTIIEVGSTCPDFTLEEVDGGTIRRDTLTASGAAVLIFFRFATCPACTIAIPHYALALAPTLRALGVKLVGISPQPVPDLVEMKRRHALPFAVLSDGGNALARRLGILFRFDEASRLAAEAKGTRSRTLNGTDEWELPMPTAIVLDRSNVVRFIHVSPDWMHRVEADAIIDAVRALDHARA